MRVAPTGPGSRPRSPSAPTSPTRSTPEPCRPSLSDWRQCVTEISARPWLDLSTTKEPAQLSRRCARLPRTGVDEHVEGPVDAAVREHRVAAQHAFAREAALLQD